MPESRLKVRGWLGVGVLFSVLCIYAYLRYVRWDNVVMHAPERPAGKTYIITQSYGGQMTRAIRNMMVQQCWAGFLEEVSITEPFSVESQLVHKPIVWKTLVNGQLHDAARFSDYYNLSYYNEQSVKHGSAPLLTWEKFLSDAPRDTIAISIPTQSCSNVIVDSSCSFTEPYKTFVGVLMDMGFNLIEKICLSCSASSRPSKLDFAELFMNISRNSISIFVNSWRNYGFVSAWMKIPDYCKLAEKPESSNFLVPSASVIRHSRYYIDHFIQKKQYIGVMLRIERFLTLVSSGRSNDSVQSCLTRTRSLFEEIRSLKDLGVYVTVDIGKFGSGVMKKRGAVSRFRNGSIAAITNFVESFLRHVYNTTVTMKEWENAFVNATGGISERGYIAMVQRNIARQADCLILMGGGSFQQVAGFQYLDMKKNVKPCLYTVCVLDSFKKLFNIH